MSKQASASSATAPAPAGPGSSLSKQQVTQAVQTIYLGILEAIEAGGTQGAPGGIIYAALQHAGATQDNYDELLGSLTSLGFATLEGECYRLTARGVAFMALLRRRLAQGDAAQHAAGQAGEAR